MRSERSEHREAQHTGFYSPIKYNSGPIHPAKRRRGFGSLLVRLCIPIAFGIALGALFFNH